MMRVALLALVLSGCAGAHVQPNGTLDAYANGEARVVVCHRGGAAVVSSTGGAFLAGDCTVLRGGSMSSVFAGVISGAITGAVAYFSSGLAW